MPTSRSLRALLAGGAVATASSPLSPAVPTDPQVGHQPKTSPAENITLLTPTAAGGATDLTARTLGKQMEADLGVSVIVENRAGGAGSIGMEYLAEQDPNG